MVCRVCGRAIEPRRRWTSRGQTPSVCSERCRRARPDPGIDEAVLALLDERPRGATICPSEVARRLWPEGWRDHMEDVRMAARRLVARGLVEITQGGRAVDPSTAKGPIRVRRA
jgi:hypothetical protein